MAGESFSKICKGIVWIFLCSVVPLSAGSLKEAEQAYHKGELAETLSEREEYFNQALAIYGDVAAEESQSGRLQYNIGNSYYQLGEYAYAILHYKRALKERPRDRRIWTALRQAQEKLGIEGRISQFSMPSSKERWAIFTVSALVAFFAASLWLWTRWRVSYLLSLFSTVLSGLVLLLSFYMGYFAPFEAVVLRGVSIHRDAGVHYARIQEKPLQAGEVVEVLEPSKDGSWLRVRTSRGKIGYVQADRLDII